MKSFVLDTNVLLHNPEALYSFGDNRVILPIQVIEELDTFKSYNDEKGKSARTVARELDRFRGDGNLSRGARMENGGVLQIVLKPQNIPQAPVLRKGVTDNDIILTAYNLKLENERVIFISKDLNARIKADALGIQTADFEKQKVSIDELYSGWTEIAVSTRVIDDFYTGGTSPATEELLENQFVMLSDENNPKHSALAKYCKQEQTLKPLQYGESHAWGIYPLNREQKFCFEALHDDQIQLVTMVGRAGTGKTLLALACGLKKTMDESVYKKLLVSRPIIPMGKDIGFLPGTKDEKLHFWMQPIFDNLQFIFANDETIKRAPDEEIRYLLNSNLLELEALTYIRGRTIPRQYLIIDEAQNLTPHEVKTIISRAGKGTKIVLTGDPYQIDNPYLDSNSNGLSYCVERFKAHAIHAHITLTKSERSPLASLAAEIL